ncbi:SoxR reducing system RseC family protein [Perlabentimonas gracilis]|uniref:SoxR reducing system RseC family protein n=1 Tax=Perlabentimonas gracilis TaxID=2715279 RepID=UPI00140869FC|nr:SoxR reducing system RseC family protein [Perlabentimonas gracilis]NHB67144.1 SoxR reducing system RseC family protein [Perlabentimonas gracilis]
MAKRIKTVDHLGRVQEINSDNIVVSIISQSACAGCHAKGACGLSDTAEKHVHVCKPNHNLKVGESVRVILKQSLGFKALLLGYVLPFVAILTVLVTLTSLNVSEGKAGLASLAILVPYYYILYLFKDKISNHFTFEIEST